MFVAGLCVVCRVFVLLAITRGSICCVTVTHRAGLLCCYCDMCQCFLIAGLYIVVRRVVCCDMCQCFLIAGLYIVVRRVVCCVTAARYVRPEVVTLYGKTLNTGLRHPCFFGGMCRKATLGVCL